MGEGFAPEEETLLCAASRHDDGFAVGPARRTGRGLEEAKSRFRSKFDYLNFASSKPLFPDSPAD